MISIEPPDDMISISLYNILTYRKEEEYLNLLNNWDKTIMFEIDDFYPVNIEFSGDQITFKRTEPQKKADLKIKMSLETLLDIAYGRMNPVKAFISGKLKIKGFYKIFTLNRFMKIFLDTIKMMAEDPNDKYYKLTINQRGKDNDGN
ncbi:MAG: hypothetical protein BAJALOKI2v1_160033 [Promethearchaeota archaeon]|nr:MAG: hypothetical protein BAJALOKI2v1_160033 [Candidatus Lokiarchaeota archaeon]